MKIEFKYEKKNNIRFAAALFLAVVLYFAAECSLWVIVVYAVLYYLLQNIKITLDERFSWLWTAILFAGGSAFTMFSIQYLLLEPELFSRTADRMLFLNALCCLAVYLLALLITNQAGISCMIAHLLLLVIGFINYFVYLFRQNEFTFSDLRSIGTGLSVAGNYRFRLEDRGVYVILATVLFLTLVQKCHVTFQEKIHMRIISVMLLAIVCMWVGLETQGVNTETWEQKGSYRNGYLLNFVLSVRDSYIREPEGYSKEEVARLEKEYRGSGESDALASNEKEPTIIVIMNESFADLSVLGELKTNQPLTPFLDFMTENTVKGYALSSVFGAKTPNSEWEYMTGNTMAFLPSGSVVYQQYIGKHPSSIVSFLKNKGYTCVAMHPYYETGWSRNQVYPDMGYDEMHFIQDFDQTKILRKYITDEELYDKIIERYENRGVNEKLYLLGITMQNHGGYAETYANFEEDVYKLGRSYTDANQYLSLVHQSDLALEKLITYFSSVEEPVEIVFFGDHQPSLNSNFYPILNGKGLSGLSLEELEALYTVPFFIWTNYPSEAENVPITSINYLSTMTLERAGLELPAYNRFLDDMQTVIPAINSRGYYSLEKGEYRHLEDASGEEAKWIQKYRILQYNSMFDQKNRSALFFPY